MPHICNLNYMLGVVTFWLTLHTITCRSRKPLKILNTTKTQRFYIVFGELTSIHQLNMFQWAGLWSLKPIHNHVFITNVPPMTPFFFLGGGGYVRWLLFTSWRGDPVGSTRIFKVVRLPSTNLNMHSHSTQQAEHMLVFLDMYARSPQDCRLEHPKNRNSYPLTMRFWPRNHSKTTIIWLQKWFN